MTLLQMSVNRPASLDFPNFCSAFRCNKSNTVVMFNSNMSLYIAESIRYTQLAEENILKLQYICSTCKVSMTGK